MNKNLNSILCYSYNPGCCHAGLPSEITDSVQKEVIEGNYSTLIDGVHDAFTAAVDEVLSEIGSDKKHIVPLSSGLDSRAILAILLNHPQIDSSEVQTVSFGSPGTWDYEIGQQVATVAGVSNTAIDLTKESFDWSHESIQQYASQQEIPTRVLDGYINSKILNIVQEDQIVWSGYLGDPSAGDHQPQSPRKDWNSACDHFVEHEKFCQELTHPDFDPRSILPDKPFLSREYLSLEEQLDFALRQQCLISPIVNQSERHVTPFLQPSWLKFSLNLPSEYRQDRILFKKSFMNHFPKLFSLPTDANSGLPLSVKKGRKWIRNKRLGLNQRLSSLFKTDYIHPGTNYINFPTEFRIDSELRDTMYLLLSNFADRDIADWIDPHQIWEEHQNGQDRSNAIRVITSLELHAGDI